MNFVHMHQFRVSCNKTLIASFPTKRQADQFKIAREDQFKGNHYEVVERLSFGS